MKFEVDDINVQILQCITEGKTDAEIAEKVCRASKTVEKRIQKMMHDAGAKNRTVLVLKAIKKKIIEYDFGPPAAYSNRTPFNLMNKN